MQALTLLTLVLVALPAAAQESIGRVLSVRGRATLRTQAAVEVLKEGQHLLEGAVIETEAASAVRLLMKDRSILDIGASSRVNLATYNVHEQKRSVGIHLHIGRLWARVTKAFGGGKNFEVTSENAVAGVRGTEFVVDVAADGHTEVTVVSGSVEVLHRLSQNIELLGALDRGIARLDGTLERGRITPEELEALGHDLRPERGLDRDRSKDRQDDARDKAREQRERHQNNKDAKEREQRERDRQRKEGRLDQLGGAGPGGQQAPVNLEPGSGETRVKGQAVPPDGQGED